MGPNELSNKLYPKPGQRFTLAQIEHLPLDDSPGLMVRIKGQQECVQNSHVTEAAMFAACPALRESMWEYEETTDEWIPIFKYVGPDEQLKDLFDWETYRDPYRDVDEKPSLWVTPKGSPREQFYTSDVMEENGLY